MNVSKDTFAIKALLTTIIDFKQLNVNKIIYDIHKQNQLLTTCSCSHASERKESKTLKLCVFIDH